MNKKTRRLLSEDLQEVFSHGIRVFWGIVFFLFALAFIVALASYNPEDLSFNVANKQDPTNLLSTYGSYTSDLLIQLFGYASYAVPLTLLSWSWRSFYNTKINWYRLLLILVTSLSSSCFFFYLPCSIDGNFFGKAVADFAGKIFKNFPHMRMASNVIMPIFWMAASIMSFCYSTKTPLSSVTSACSKVCSVIWLGGNQAFSFCKKIISFMLGLENLDFKNNSLDLPEDNGVFATLYTPRASDNSQSQPEKLDSTKRDEESPRMMTDFTLPPLDFLHQTKFVFDKVKLDQHTLESNSKRLKNVLEEFGIRGDIIGTKPGPVITLYELQPAAGIKSSRVIGLASDIARSMSAISARVAVVPGRNVIGIELPNIKRQTVFLRELLSDEVYKTFPSPLAVALGKDIGGEVVIADLAKMPHLLVAGTTGSGKSVGINAMILSLLYKLSPDQCKLIMIDPKMLELSVYDGIPHLLAPVVTDPKKAVVALKWAVSEMESRYRTMSKLGVRNIEGYNTKVMSAKKSGEDLSYKVQTGYDPETGLPIYEYEDIPPDPFPYIVIIVDEMADLMLTAGKEIDATVQRLAQMARAAGIHLIMATQRPSVDVITGTIKANFPSRISFQVASRIDSRTILGDQGGSEQLLGQGDMLYMSSGGRIIRIHGPFVSDQEVEKIVQYLKQFGQPSYIEDITKDPEEDDDLFFDKSEFSSQKDPLYDQALEAVLREGRATTSFIQRYLQIGYNRAARMIERMEKEGVVSKPNHSGKRDIIT